MDGEQEGLSTDVEHAGNEIEVGISELEEEQKQAVEIVEPTVGMKFVSEQEMCDYFKAYGTCLQGFPIKKRSTKKDDDGNLRYIVFACSRKGKKTTRTNNILKPQPSTKNECKASLNAGLHDPAIAHTKGQQGRYISKGEKDVKIKRRKHKRSSEKLQDGENKDPNKKQRSQRKRCSNKTNVQKNPISNPSPLVDSHYRPLNDTYGTTAMSTYNFGGVSQLHMPRWSISEPTDAIPTLDLNL